MNFKNKLYNNNRYLKIKEIGKGSYGKINLCTDKTIDKNNVNYYVAIKKLKIKDELGIDLSTIREIKTNRIISSIYVIKFLNIFYENNKLYIVMNYYPIDLFKFIINKNINWNRNYTKFIMYQITKGLEDIHNKFYIHRDLKPENILLDDKLNCKIADFGLTKEILYNDQEITKGVCTRWYRPPEVLLYSSVYNNKIDIWSLGCIFAELLLKKPIFRGDTEIDQLSKIFGILGTPNENNWPNYNNYPLNYKFEKRNKIPFKSLIPNIDDLEIFLLDNMLQLDPNKRLSCKEILQSSYFNEVRDLSLNSINAISKLDLRYI